MLRIRHKMSCILFHFEMGVGHDIVYPKSWGNIRKRSAYSFSSFRESVFPVALNFKVCIRVRHIVKVAANDLRVWASIDLRPNNFYLLAPEFVPSCKFEGHRL